ncbi:MAG TPA: hypothetical protein VKP69_16725 [Isosphaeraceae bacterium]|nr:hypothetical protein [Isosphaeraceae bacterium]
MRLIAASLPLPQEAGTPVSVTVVKQLLRKYRYVKRKAQKSQAMGV